MDAIGYDADDLQRLRELARSPLDRPEVIRNVLDNLGYLDDWRTDYRVKSVRTSLRSSKITCIDAAILAYGLLELVFRDVKRRLLAIHRRDRKGEECGHCVALYWNDEGKVGAFSKSSYPLLCHRDPIYADEFAAATSFAESYIQMGIEPLYFGVVTLEDIAEDIDWRCSPDSLNTLCDRIQARYEYSFMLAR